MAVDLTKTPAGCEAVSVSSGRTAQLLVLALAIWVAVYARTALSPLQEAMRGALAFSDNQMGILQGPAIALSVMIGSIPVGLLIDRYCRVRLMLLFLVASLLGSVVTALASNFLVLFLARALVGLAHIASLVAAFSLIADMYAPGQRGRATIMVTSSELGASAAFAIGGALLVMYSGSGAEGDAWRQSLLWMTALPLVVVIALVSGLREPPRTGLTMTNPPVRAALAKLWRHRAVIVPLLAARSMVGVADGATVIWAAPLLARRFQLSPDRIGAVMAAALLIAGLTSSIAGGVLADLCHRKGGPRRTLQVMGALALLSVPASLFGIAPGALSTSVLLVTFVTLGFTVNVAGAALSTIVVPNEVRGTFLSVSMVAGAIFGVALAPLLVSALSGALGGTTMIGQSLTVVCGASSILGAATFAFGSRMVSRVPAARIVS